MKKIILTSLIASTFTMQLFAAETVDCSSYQIFGENSCDVCSISESETATKQGDQYETTITGVSFEWKNTSDSYHELIYKGEQELPQIISNLQYTQDPQDDERFWEYGEKVLWTEYEGIEEYYTDPGSSLTHRKMNNDASIRVQAFEPPLDESYILFVSPLKYRDFDIESFEESDVQVRNYCQRMLVPFEAAVEPIVEPEPEVEVLPEIDIMDDFVEPDPIPTMEVVTPEPEVELESAGPDPAPVVITSHQTNTQSGPAHVFLVILAAAIGLMCFRRKKAL